MASERRRICRPGSTLGGPQRDKPRRWDPALRLRHEWVVEGLLLLEERRTGVEGRFHSKQMSCSQ